MKKSLFARIVLAALFAITLPAALAADKLVPSPSDNGAIRRFRDMGDGTWAEVISSTPTTATGTSSVTVQGVGAAGAAVTGNPVLLGGSDGANARTLLTDTTGRQVMVGGAAAGAAKTGNPVMVGGQDGANAQTLLTDTSGRVVNVGAAASGAAKTGNPLLVGGQDGTNAQTILTDTSGRVVITGPTANGGATAGNPIQIAGNIGGATIIARVDAAGNQAVGVIPLGTAVRGTSGNVANASAVATLTGAAGQFTFITGFECTASGATAGLPVNVTLAGVAGGTMTYTFTFPAGVLVGATPLIVNFSAPIPSSAVNTNIVVTMPAGGAGNTNAACNAHGFLYS